MPEREIYVARLRRLPLHGPDGIPLGRIDDVVISPSGPRDAPRVLGFVVSVQRRAIFVNAARVGEIDSSGARLASGRLDVRRFERRPGEILAGDILDRTFGGEVVNDLAIRPVEGELRQWEVASVSLSAAGLLRRRRAGRIVRWTEVRALFDAGPLARHVAALRDLHPADVAEAIAALSPEGRRELAAAMEDDRLADLLEELPEEEQLELISTLGVERIADILEEMEPDDAADLLGEMGPDERATVLEAMEPDDAGPILRLLSYDENTAGGLMTPEPLILPADATVAEALARMRDSDVPAAIAAHVFVVEAPFVTPTGRYLGPVGFQRLLREAPGTCIADCVDDVPEAIPPETPEAEVARRLAAYDVVSLPVCDAAGRLVGAVTVDDVLDRVLPEGWRQRTAP